MNDYVECSSFPFDALESVTMAAWNSRQRDATLSKSFPMVLIVSRLRFRCAMFVMTCSRACETLSRRASRSRSNGARDSMILIDSKRM